MAVGRVGRCRALVKAGAVPALVVRSGLNKAQTWGRAAMGVSDAELSAMRKIAARSISCARG
eukprot:7103342-Lingulodinium_polyedra.AAC.1